MSFHSIDGGRDDDPWNSGGHGIEGTLGEDKFRNAHEKLQAAVQKHLKEAENDSSSEEEVLESDSILTTVFRNYTQLNTTHEGVEKTRQFLENIFQSGAGVCLICIANIKRIHPIWSCLECFGYYHLTCIQKWAKDSILQQKLAQEDLPSFRKPEKINWVCPKCRHEYEQNDVPQKYYCFCGKVEDPPHQPWLVPHSCGEKCNKPFKPVCGHSCLLLCHPGPCPPCPQMVQSYCHCRKQGPRFERCCKKFWSCSGRCKKPLICKKHFCEEFCHSGECPPCPKESKQKCKCGFQERKQPCFNPVWECDKVCGKPFSCGFHKCSLVCHEGPCGECPLSKERSCPCGKTSFVLPCTEDVPTCNDTCDKVLDCGSHRCSQKCHKKKCGLCLEIVTKVCRCGLHRKSLPCQKEFLCDTKCKRLKNCSRHPCNRKCCDLMCPPCEKPCGRTLKCGYHKCPSVCHRGQCYPCPQVAQVKCKCGGTVITVPCGRQKKTLPPVCSKLCGNPPDCHHSSRDPHNCHFGVCPPCLQMCGKDRENCSHKCLARCHSSIWVKVGDSPRAGGPWEVAEPKVKRCSLPCPDCTVPVPVTCLGGHETSDWPCFKARPSSCQRPCGRLLECGNHVCEKLCHVVTGAGDSLLAGENCMECESKCIKERPPGCTHSCRESCHPGPCPPCNSNLKVKCHCGISVLYIRCDELARADADTKISLMSCGNKCPKNYPCGHQCKSNCHPYDCPDPDSCNKKVRLTCKCGTPKKLSCGAMRAANLTLSSVLNCDEACAAKKEEEKIAKEFEREKKRQEEEKKNREELERFEKKFHGRRKPHKEKIQPAQEPSFLSRYWVVILGAIAGAVATLFFLLPLFEAAPTHF